MVAWNEPPTCTGCWNVWQYCVTPTGLVAMASWLISAPVRLLAMSMTVPPLAVAAGVVPSAPRRTETVLVTRFGSLVTSTRSPVGSSITSPFMKALASVSVSWPSPAPTAAFSVANRLRNARLTIVKTVEPTGMRGSRVTSGQRLTNQLIATTLTSLRIWAWLSRLF